MNLSITDTSFLLVMLFLFSRLSNANDTINTTHSIRDNQTLVSSGGSFELGFFTPGNSKNWYIGIWYKNITPKTVVWVANRDIPLKNSTSAELKLTQTGHLAILDETNNSVWSSNNSRPARNPVAQLLESGNLVLREANDDQPENYIWQSFEYPTDTVLPGMDFGSNSVRGRENYISSWKTNEDPSPGDSRFYLDTAGHLQMFTKKGGVVLSRMGPWNGLVFSGTPSRIRDPTFTLGMYKNKKGGFYVREDAIDRTVASRFTLDPSGVGRRWTWIDRTQGWVPYLNFP